MSRVHVACAVIKDLDLSGSDFFVRLGPYLGLGRFSDGLYIGATIGS